MGIVETVAAVTAAAFLVKFLIGRRLIVDKQGQVKAVTCRGVTELVPSSVERDVRRALERLESAQRRGRALPQIVRHEVGRLVEICKRRHVEKMAEVVEALIRLTNARFDLRLALDDVENVDQEIRLRHGERDLREMEQEDRRDELMRRARRRDREEEREQLELDRLRAAQKPPDPPKRQPPLEERVAKDLERTLEQSLTVKKAVSQARQREYDRIDQDPHLSPEERQERRAEIDDILQAWAEKHVE